VLVRVVGVDLAAEPARTAVAVLGWDNGKAVVEDLRVGADDEAVLTALAAADKAGIDAPFGWPDAFTVFLAAHQVGDVPVPGGLTGQQWRRQLAWRHTDETVRTATGIIPLSVAADRIAHAAMRCAGLLAKLGNAGRPVDRDGSGTVAEVYPAASLKQWGLPYRGYKQPRNLSALPELATALQAAAPWLELGPHDRLCRISHDALDAVIAALTARAAALGLTLVPDPELQPQASREGWIALPTAPLAELAEEFT
jgi:predicted nuclease with RNAse H fold